MTKLSFPYFVLLQITKGLVENVIYILTCQHGFIVAVHRAVTKALIWGGGLFSYIRVLIDEFLLKSTVITTDFKRSSSGRTPIR